MVVLLFPKESTVSVSDISHCEFVLLGKCILYEHEMKIKRSEERNLYYEVNTNYNPIVNLGRSLICQFPQMRTTTVAGYHCCIPC
jgi:hypothetical protein